MGRRAELAPWDSLLGLVGEWSFWLGGMRKGGILREESRFAGGGVTEEEDGDGWGDGHDGGRICDFSDFLYGDDVIWMLRLSQSEALY